MSETILPRDDQYGLLALQGNNVLYGSSSSSFTVGRSKEAHDLRDAIDAMPYRLDDFAVIAERNHGHILVGLSKEELAALKPIDGREVATAEHYHPQRFRAGNSALLQRRRRNVYNAVATGATTLGAAAVDAFVLGVAHGALGLAGGAAAFGVKSYTNRRKANRLASCQTEALRALQQKVVDTEPLEKYAVTVKVESKEAPLTKMMPWAANEVRPMSNYNIVMPYDDWKQGDHIRITRSGVFGTVMNLLWQAESHLSSELWVEGGLMDAAYKADTAEKTYRTIDARRARFMRVTELTGEPAIDIEDQLEADRETARHELVMAFIGLKSYYDVILRHKRSEKLTAVLDGIAGSTPDFSTMRCPDESRQLYDMTYKRLLGIEMHDATLAAEQVKAVMAIFAEVNGLMYDPLMFPRLKRYLEAQLAEAHIGAQTS